MKTYGLIVADNGSDMYVQGTYDTRWDNDVLNPAFASLKVSDFEVVAARLAGRRASRPTPASRGPGPSCNEWLLPSSARIGGEGGAFYTTDLTVANTGVTEATVFVRFLGHDADGRSGAGSLVPPRGRALRDVGRRPRLALRPRRGVGRASSSAPRARRSSSRARPGRRARGGTFGQSVPLVSETELIRSGATRTIPAVREDALVPDEPRPRERHRGARRRRRVARLRGRATSSARAASPLPPLGMTQVTRVVRELGVSSKRLRRAARPLDADGRRSASPPTPPSSTKRTNDPRTLLPR